MDLTFFKGWNIFYICSIYICSYPGKETTTYLLLSWQRVESYFFFFSFIFISWRLITLQYYSGFCHTLTWISHGFICVPHPDPPSHLPPHPIPLDGTFWTLWEKVRVGCFERTACILSIVKQLTSPGGMHETSARAWCTGKTQRDRVEREVEGASGWGTHINPWLIHVSVCQKPLQYCKVLATTIL